MGISCLFPSVFPLPIRRLTSDSKRNGRQPIKLSYRVPPNGDEGQGVRYISKFAIVTFERWIIENDVGIAPCNSELPPTILASGVLFHPDLNIGSAQFS